MALHLSEFTDREMLGMFALQNDFEKNQSDLGRIRQRIDSFKMRQADPIKRAQDQSDAETQRANDRETERRRHIVRSKCSAGSSARLYVLFRLFPVCRSYSVMAKSPS